jgi:hypothetical protein
LPDKLHPRLPESACTANAVSRSRRNIRAPLALESKQSAQIIVVGEVVFHQFQDSSPRSSANSDGIKKELARKGAASIQPENRR